MVKYHGYVFVIWGDNFDEAAAAIFITELRRAGLRVKVVGLTQQAMRGTHGMAILPDLTLEEALLLATQARYIIIPCPAPHLKRLRNEPRLRQFFDLCHTNQARFIVNQTGHSELAALELLPPAALEQLLVYPGGADLVSFANGLAGLVA
jgi:hypothetical protein